MEGNKAYLDMRRQDWLCTEESFRYALSGVMVRRAKVGAMLLSTSGRHLAVRRAEDAELGDGFTEAIVPNVCRGAKAERVTIGVLADGIAATDQRHGKTIDGKFPKVEDVITDVPEDSIGVLVRPQYLVDVAKIVSGEPDESVTLFIDVKANQIRVVGSRGIGVVMLKTASGADELDRRKAFNDMGKELRDKN